VDQNELRHIGNKFASKAVQVGTDMLYEIIPTHPEFFGFGTATPEELRAVSQIRQ
jgi:hypothetical protein